MPQFQVLPEQPSFGNQLAQQIGAGFSSGLQQKLQQHELMQQKKSQAKALSNYIPEKQALTILQQPQELQKPLLYQAFYENMVGNKGTDTEIDIQNDIVPKREEKKGISSLSTDKLKGLLNNPIYSKSAEAELRERSELTKDVRKSDIKRSDKYLDEINKERDTNQRSKSSLNTIEQALEKKDLSFFSPDNLKSMVGFGRWISPEGAILNTASKEFFLSDMERIMGRPNQFLEKILSNALPQLGKSNEANQTIVEFYKNAIDIQEEKINITDRLEDYYRDKMGYVPGNIGRLVNAELKPYTQQKEKELLDIFKHSKEKFGKKEKTDFIVMIDPSGAVRNVPKEDATKAQKAGYKLKK